ncbi:MAG: OsmC family protein [Solirubrobacterales bacterium]|nr:OsmC family protein [Solirubrobacterales bacterium]
MTRAIVTSGVAFPTEVELSSGRTMSFDEPSALGGQDSAPTATEGVTASLAACTVGTLRIYADRKGWDLEGLEVTVDTTYEGPNPKLFEVTVSVPDRFDDHQATRLLRIAGKCPVHRLLAAAPEAQVTQA